MPKDQRQEQFQKNIDAMPEHMEGLRELLLKKMPKNPDMQVGVEEIEGRKVLYLQKGDRFFQLDSMYGSEELLEKWRQGIDALYNSKYVCFGFGNGMFLRTLLEHTGKETLFFVYEPYVQVLHTVFREFDLTDILSSGRVYLMTSEMEQGEADFYSLWANHVDYADVQGARRGEYLNYPAVFPEEYKKICDIYDAVLESVVSNRIVLQRFGWSFYVNTLQNYPYFMSSKSLSSLWAYIPKETTAIIVSSGPSLIKNIEELKRAKGKSLLVAADSAVQVLLNHGIVPDLFVCVDANKDVRHFQDDRVKDIPAIGNLHTSNSALQGHRAPCFFINDANPHIQAFLTEQGIVLPLLSSGGSVATDAMSAMELLGIETFILVGQDLAYTNHKTHAEGSLRASWNVDISPTSCYLEGNDGKEILSSSEFKLYRDWFEREIQVRPNLRVINATEGGAKIHGAETLTLREAIEECCTKPVEFARILKKTGNLLTHKQQKAFLAYMKQIKPELQKAERTITKGIHVYQDMQDMVMRNDYHKELFLKDYKKTKKVYTFLEKTPVMYYPECWIQVEVGQSLKDVYLLEQEERKELLTVIKKGIHYLQMMKGRVKNSAINAQDMVLQSEEAALNLMESCRKTEFQDEELQEVWEILHRYIDPDIGMEGYVALTQYLDYVNTLKRKAEYPKLLEIIVEHVEAVKEDMVLYQLILLSFCYRTTKSKDYLLRLKEVILKNSLLHLRQRYYLWWYLKREELSKLDDLYEQILKGYEKELKKELLKLQKNQATEETAAVWICMGGMEKAQASFENFRKDMVQAGRKVILLYTQEEGAANGRILLYGENSVENSQKPPVIKADNDESDICVIAAEKPMPSKTEYRKLLQKLMPYRIETVQSDAGSVLGDLLQKYRAKGGKGNGTEYF